MIEVALLGNPNTGKTSLFNNLTGSYEYVGNWSGVTVEKKIGTLRNHKGMLIDLPGVYSLNPVSRDESVVTTFLLKENFTNILNIVDASQLERNLQLTIQLLEYGKPITIGLNMTDVAKNRGIIIDEKKLASLLNISVFPIIARSGKGCELLGEQLVTELEGLNAPLHIDYGKHLEEGINKISKLLEGKVRLPIRWLALQFFEKNSYVQNFLNEIIDLELLNTIYDETIKAVTENKNVKNLNQLIYQKRKLFIQSIVDQTTTRKTNAERTLTEKIDVIVTNKIIGVPIFILAMYLMFQLTFDWLGFPISDLLDAFFSGPLTNWLTDGLTAIGASTFIKALIIDGIVAGVGGVLVFVPQIFILFLFISFLEDSGYMARVALVMDRIMESVGLNGKAFIPMIIGFGCNVPGVMAARTIEQPKERLLTTLLTPLMSCSARLPVYALFVGAFFAKYQALVVLSLYLLGIVMAFVLAKLFSSTILKGETSVFVVELPPYRMPQFKTLLRSTWDKGKGFIKKAGTFIFGGSVIIWLLSYAGPSGVAANMDDSFLALIGGLFAPLLSPIGFGTWQAGAALLTGFLAKEVVVSTMNIIYHVPNVESLQGVMVSQFSPLAAFSFMVFVLLYIPCLATVATIHKETSSVKWTLFSMGYALVIAYALSFLIYQIGHLLGF